MIKTQYLILILLCWGALGIAQQDYYGGYSAAAVATPTAATATRASSATVDLATGSVQHSIPIHTISQDGVSWGVGLQYHYSGLKVLEEPSSIGLGWGLAATGMVSREVRGLPDEHPNGYYGSEGIKAAILDPYYYFDENDSADTNGKQVIKEHNAYRLANGLIDGEPDVFHVNAGRLNFSFKIGLDGQPILLSHHNVQINFDWDQIEVIDSEGVRYTFAAKEIFTPKKEEDMLCVLSLGAVMPSYTRSWYLTTIQPPNTSAQISFAYTYHQQKTRAFVPKVYSCKSIQSEFLDDLGAVKVDQDGEEGEFELYENSDPYIYTHVNLEVEVQLPVLTQINFAKGSLQFTPHTLVDNTHHQYQSIALKDPHNNTIHTYDLTTSGSRRLLTHVYKNDEFLKGFRYYHQEETDAIPDFEYDKEEPSSRMDAWGYYNGSQSNDNQLTSTATTYSALEGTMMGALQHITYPTGGITTIYYESNSCLLYTSPSPRDA